MSSTGKAASGAIGGGIANINSNATSTQLTNAKSAAVATAPRVTLEDIEGMIAEEYTFTADLAVPAGAPSSAFLGLMTLCIMVLQNGFIIVGKSAPASAANFNAVLGAEFARDDAIRQIWPLMAFALRSRLAAGG